MATRRPQAPVRTRRALAVAISAVLFALAAAPSAPADVPGGGEQRSGPRFVRPIDGEVLRPFDPPDRPWLSGHRGVDLAASLAEPVHAAGEGTVAFAGVVVDRPLVSIDHPVGIRTTYEPVDPIVSAGERVARGQVIGWVHPGNGHCTGACLHWGARTGPDAYIDPLRLLRPLQIRLYPPEPW